LMLSPEAADKLVNAGVDKTPRGLERPSDHTPVWVEVAA
jgi:exodeoxyribonuclease-3